MTRINCVPPEELTDKHLLAEYRELPRVFALAYGAYRRGMDETKLPKQYTLGKGHVLFFYDKLVYLEKRFNAIYLECRKRGWRCTYDRVPALPRMPTSWQQDWVPTPEALQLNRQRIADRIATRKDPYASLR